MSDKDLSLSPRPVGEGDIDLSVVIVNYNCATATVAAVASVIETSGALNVEIFVVDNDSRDDSVDVIRNACPQATVIAAGHNGGYAWGNNIGIGQARGRHVLVLNPDAIIQDGALERAVAYLDDHQEVGVLGAGTVDETGVIQQTRFRFPKLRFTFWRAFLPYSTVFKSRHFGDQRYASMPADQISDVEAVVGCFMMVPCSVIEIAGAMNPKFFMYGEETEWCWRIRNCGFRVHYHPEVQITHTGGVSTGPISPWSVVETARSHILFLRISRGPFIASAGTILLILSDLLRGFWFVPRMLTAAGRDASKSWSRRIRFLCYALFVQPKGQEPPDIEIGRADNNRLQMH